MPGERDIRHEDNYLKKLNTLLPAELTGLYFFVRALSQGDRDLDLYLALVVVMMGVTFYFVAPRILKVGDALTRIIYVLTFFVWVASIDVIAIHIHMEWDPLLFLVPALAAIWSFSIPYIFDGIKERTNASP